MTNRRSLIIIVIDDITYILHKFSANAPKFSTNENIEHPKTFSLTIKLVLFELPRLAKFVSQSFGSEI